MNAAFEPARPVLAAYTRQPFDNPAPVPIIAEPRTREVADLAALAYELVLQTLNRFFTHTDETDQQLATLVRVAVGLNDGRAAPAGNGADETAGRRAARWLHGRLCVRDVLHAG